MDKKQALKIAQEVNLKVQKEQERIDKATQKSKEEIYIDDWKKKKESPEFKEELKKVRIESNLLKTANSLKVAIPKFDGEIPEAVKTQDVGVIQDCFTLYLAGYNNTDIASMLSIANSAVATIKREYDFETRKDRITNTILHKTADKIAEVNVKKNVKVLPEMGGLIEKMLDRMKEYLDNPDQYGISHEIVYKQTLEWLKTYGKATGEFQDNVNLEIGTGQVFNKIMEMDASQIDVSKFDAEVLEEPKLIE